MHPYPSCSVPASRPTARTISGVVLLSMLLMAAVPGVRAGFVHAPFAPLAVEVGGSSSVFNSVVGFNGSRADFGGPWGSQWDVALQNYSTGWQTFSATFQADPGNVFTSAVIGFGQWSFAVPEGGWLWFEMNWSLPGSTYGGGNNVAYNYYNSPGGASWQVGSGGGNYQYWHHGNQGGGGFQFMPIMDFGVPLILGNVSTFSVNFSARIQHGGAYFGDGRGAGLGFSDFQVTAYTAPGNPPPSAVPEFGATAALLGATLLGLLAVGTRTVGRRRLAAMV